MPSGRVAKRMEHAGSLVTPSGPDAHDAVTKAVLSADSGRQVEFTRSHRGAVDRNAVSHPAEATVVDG